MDDRTTRLLDALDPMGVEVLLELLAGAATEAGLVEAIEDATQPTINRRLGRLADAGLVSHEAGKPHTPGLQWSVNHPQETDTLLQRMLDLVDTVDSASREQREAAKQRLTRARTRRLGLYDAGQRRSE